MDKKIITVCALGFAAALLWQMASSRSRLGSADDSSVRSDALKPSAKVGPIQGDSKASVRSLASPPPPTGLGQRTRAAALAAFEQGRRGSGTEHDVSPLQVYNEKKLPLSKVRTFNTRSYHVLGARAVPRERYTSAMGDIHFERNGFAVVGLAAGSIEAWQDMVFRESDRPVVVNPSNGRLGIVTGTLAVKLKNMDAAEGLAARESLRILTVDEYIGIVYVRPQEGIPLLRVEKRLNQIPDVERVEIEIYDTRKEAK